MKEHYPWWGYVKAIVRAYPALAGRELSGVDLRNYEAVERAVEATKHMGNAGDRLKLIEATHWLGTHTLDGAALLIPCNRATAARWQRRFFEEVARNRGLMD